MSNMRATTNKTVSLRTAARRAGSGYSQMAIEQTRAGALVCLVPDGTGEAGALAERLHQVDQGLAQKWAAARRRPDKSGSDGAAVLALPLSRKPHPLVVYVGYRPEEPQTAIEATRRAVKFAVACHIDEVAIEDPMQLGLDESGRGAVLESAEGNWAGVLVHEAPRETMTNAVTVTNKRINAGTDTAGGVVGAGENRVSR